MDNIVFIILVILIILVAVLNRILVYQMVKSNYELELLKREIDFLAVDINYCMKKLGDK